MTAAIASFSAVPVSFRVSQNLPTRRRSVHWLGLALTASAVLWVSIGSIVITILA